jgi:hypothetical protein
MCGPAIGIAMIEWSSDVYRYGIACVVQRLISLVCGPAIDINVWSSDWYRYEQRLVSLVWLISLVCGPAIDIAKNVWSSDWYRYD